MLLPVEALISMPLWFEDAPAVGDLRFPNPDVMRPLAGHGQRSEELPVEVVVVLPVFPFAVELFVFPAAAAFLAASSAAFFAASSASFFLISASICAILASCALISSSYAFACADFSPICALTFWSSLFFSFRRSWPFRSASSAAGKKWKRAGNWPKALST